MSVESDFFSNCVVRLERPIEDDGMNTWESESPGYQEVYPSLRCSVVEESIGSYVVEAKSYISSQVLMGRLDSYVDVQDRDVLVDLNSSARYKVAKRRPPKPSFAEWEAWDTGIVLELEEVS